MGKIQIQSQHFRIAQEVLNAFQNGATSLSYDELQIRLRDAQEPCEISPAGFRRFIHEIGRSYFHCIDDVLSARSKEDIMDYEKFMQATERSARPHGELPKEGAQGGFVRASVKHRSRR